VLSGADALSRIASRVVVNRCCQGQRAGIRRSVRTDLCGPPETRMVGQWCCLRAVGVGAGERDAFAAEDRSERVGGDVDLAAADRTARATGRVRAAAVGGAVVAEAYLASARARPNLQIRPNALVERVVMRAQRAVGIELDGELIDADCVVLSGGAYGTPAVLMRSGIGDPAHLAELGIETVLGSRASART